MEVAVHVDLVEINGECHDVGEVNKCPRVVHYTAILLPEEQERIIDDLGTKKLVLLGIGKQLQKRSLVAVVSVVYKTWQHINSVLYFVYLYVLVLFFLIICFCFVAHWQFLFSFSNVNKCLSILAPKLEDGIIIRCHAVRVISVDQGPVLKIKLVAENVTL